MTSLGLTELLVVGIVLLIAVGPEKLPHATRTLGRLYGRLRRAADDLRRALVLEADRLDEEDRLRDLRRKRQEAEAARERALAEGGDGPRPQRPADLPDAPSSPEAADAPASAQDAAPVRGDDPTAQPAPGFSAEEWAELPAHVRAIIARRREET